MYVSRPVGIWVGMNKFGAKIVLKQSFIEHFEYLIYEVGLRNHKAIEIMLSSVGSRLLKWDKAVH